MIIIWFVPSMFLVLIFCFIHFINLVYMLLMIDEKNFYEFIFALSVFLRDPTLSIDMVYLSLGLGMSESVIKL